MTADIAPQIPWDQITTIAICILSSTWFSNIIVNHKSKKDISDKLDMMIKRMDETDAKNARIHILRTNDELLQSQRHSKEYFDDVMDDITSYTNYCRTHPDFTNGRTKMAIENIERTYRTCMEKHSFL